jgi:hypothetical protein
MPKPIKKTVNNPYGLTSKRLMVLDQVDHNLKEGRGMGLVDAIEMTYDIKENKNKRTTAMKIRSRNLQSMDFRQALVDTLTRHRIVGANGKVSRRLMEGLDAETDEGTPAHHARLGYIREINKVVGVYAPLKVERRSFSLNANISEAELDSKIKRLQEELGK